MEFGNKREKESGILFALLWVVRFTLVKFFQRDRLRTRVPFLLPCLFCLASAFECDSVQRVDHMGPEFMKITP